MLVGFAVVTIPVSLVFQKLTGHLGLVPPSGGINLYIGNNADYDRTINIRPGLEWAELVAEPIKAGHDPNPWASDPYYRKRALDYVINDPGGAVELLFEKTLTLFSSREMPRNLDMYLHRDWSPALSILVWKKGSWGFPFGLVIPFALVGFWYARGREANRVKLLSAAMSLAMVGVFVSARYRVLLVPLLVVFAAVGVVEVLNLVTDKNRRKLIPVLLIIVACVLVSTIPGPFAQETVDLRAEYYFGIGHDLYDKEEWSRAAEYMQKSIELDPDVHASRQVMGIAAAKLNRYDDAVLHFREAVRLRPGHRSTESNLEKALRQRARIEFQAGKEIERYDPAVAIDLYRKSASDQPKWYKPLAQEALLLATTNEDSLRDGELAVDLANRAIRLRGAYDPSLVYVLVCGLAESGRLDEARDAAGEAVRILSTGGDDELLSWFRGAIERISAGESIEVGGFDLP